MEDVVALDSWMGETMDGTGLSLPLSGVRRR